MGDYCVSCQMKESSVHEGGYYNFYNEELGLEIGRWVCSDCSQD